MKEFIAKKKESEVFLVIYCNPQKQEKGKKPKDSTTSADEVNTESYREKQKRLRQLEKQKLKRVSPPSVNVSTLPTCHLDPICSLSPALSPV